VHDTLARAQLARLSWPLPEDLDDAALEALLYPGQKGRKGRPEPEYARMYRELRRKGVTLQLLWHEYRADHPDNGYGYSQFCDRYRRWRKQDSYVRFLIETKVPICASFAAKLMVTSCSSGLARCASYCGDRHQSECALSFGSTSPKLLAKRLPALPAYNARCHHRLALASQRSKLAVAVP